MDDMERCGSYDYPASHVEQDRHRMYEEEFNALAQMRVDSGAMNVDEAAAACADFHTYISDSRFIPNSSESLL